MALLYAMTQYWISKHFTIPVEINRIINIKAMLNTGATANFIHQDIILKHSIQTVPWKEVLTTKDIQGRVLTQITEQAVFHMRTQSHIETIIMDVMATGQHSLILGMPWMEAHYPWIKIAKKELMFTLKYCQEHCLNNDPHIAISQLEIPEADTEIYSIDGTTYMDPRKIVPPELHGLIQGFDDRQAKQMPEDWGEWNFSIDFINGWQTKLPKPAKWYQLTTEEQRVEEETLDELLQSGMISESQSPVVAPTFFMPKKDGSKRYVVDWQGINAITVKDVYPLPLLDNLLDMAQGVTIMLMLDLTASYNQILIQKEDWWKTAFITSRGLFEFNIMHFGFCNAPPHMQCYMEHVLWPVMHRNVRVYLDDIPIFSRTKEEHMKSLQMVVQTLINHWLFAKAKKCEFYLPEIDLLGVKVSAQGFRMEDKKVTEVQEWKPPWNVRGIREFLGFINFYWRSIWDFAKIARPLHNLTKKDQPWTWTAKEHTAFETLKELVTSEPVLKHADQTKEFQMEMDTSNYTYGAILSQKQDTGKRHPVVYMSKSMTPAEWNYDIGDKETLAIVKPLQHWQHWLEGTRLLIEILTDHKNLENFSNPRILNQRQTQWLHTLQKYNFMIRYRPNQQNSTTDVLSWQMELKQEIDEDKKGTLFPKEKFIELDLIAADSLTSAFLNVIMTDQEIMEQIIRSLQTLAQYDEGWIVVPANNKICQALLQLYHDSPMAGHQGITGMYKLLWLGKWLHVQFIGLVGTSIL